MKMLWICLLFLLFSTQAEKKKHSSPEIKNKTLGQAKKNSQNETIKGLKQKKPLKTKIVKENETPHIKESSPKFQVDKDLQSEIQSLKNSSNESSSKDASLLFDIKSFEKMLSGLKKEAFDSEKYKKKVRSLEKSFYNKATFESLELLAELFEQKNDRANQIKALAMAVSNYPEKPKGHFLLGIGYKQLYLQEEKDNLEIKNMAIESLSQAIKLDRKYKEAYEQLLPLLMETDPLKVRHNNHPSLELIKDMIRYLHDPSNYSLLCEAYYETDFVKQARKACRKAIEEDPKQPKNYLYLAIVQENNKDIRKKVEEVATRFQDSYPVQFKAGLLFAQENPALSIEYLRKATEIQPNSYPAHILLARLLFNADHIEESYKHFFQSCIHSNGKLMDAFQKATAQLRLKKKISVTAETSKIERKWKKGISECFNKLKENRKKKNESSHSKLRGISLASPIIDSPLLKKSLRENENNSPSSNQPSTPENKPLFIPIVIKK